MTYGICFDFPELDDPLFAYLGREGLGLTVALSEAARFSSELEADRVLGHGFSSDARQWGAVVELS